MPSLHIAVKVERSIRSFQDWRGIFLGLFFAEQKNTAFPVRLSVNTLSVELRISDGLPLNAPAQETHQNYHDQ
jgi:hypothetical protein